MCANIARMLRLIQDQGRVHELSSSFPPVSPLSAADRSRGGVIISHTPYTSSSRRSAQYASPFGRCRKWPLRHPVSTAHDKLAAETQNPFFFSSLVLSVWPYYVSLTHMKSPIHIYILSWADVSHARFITRQKKSTIWPPIRIRGSQSDDSAETLGVCENQSSRF